MNENCFQDAIVILNSFAQFIVWPPNINVRNRQHFISWPLRPHFSPFSQSLASIKGLCMAIEPNLIVSFCGFTGDGIEAIPASLTPSHVFVGVGATTSPTETFVFTAFIFGGMVLTTNELNNENNDALLEQSS